MSEVNEGKVINELSKVKDTDVGFFFPENRSNLLRKKKKCFTREKQ